MFERAPEAMTADTFSGPAYVSSLIGADNAAGAPDLHYVVFDPGVINNWHIHEGGQILIATDGIGYYQIEGEPVQIMYPGDVAFCPPGVKHWHGGSKDTKFAHIAVNTNPELKGLEWYDRISDEEYAALTTEKPAEAETETSGK
ncbi:cupin domain-containing protein [Lachnospiraceae bacterium CLA-AA-H142]|nr:cupin domain-containing protein [Clostridium sp. MCC328]